MSAQSMGDMGKGFCPNFVKPLLENVDRRNRNDGSRGPFPVFHNPHLKVLPSPSAVVHTLEHLVGVLFKAAPRRRKKKQVRINIQKAH